MLEFPYDKLEEKLRRELDVVNTAQQKIWELHHEVKQYNKPLAMKIWEQSLQIESALLHLNEELLGGKGYYSMKAKND